MKAYYWLMKKWHLYRGVEGKCPVSRFHFERFGYYLSLQRGEKPHIAKKDLYKG